MILILKNNLACFFPLFSIFYSRIPYYQSKVPVGHSLTTLIRNGIAVGNFNFSGQVGSNNNPPSFFLLIRPDRRKTFMITYSYFMSNVLIFPEKNVKCHIYKRIFILQSNLLCISPFWLDIFIGTVQTFLWEYYFL